jgi:ankyrin repeat protein
MISHESWQAFYAEIYEQLSSSSANEDIEILELMTKLDELVKLYYHKDLGYYAYHKKLSIMINIANILSLFDNLNRGANIQAEKEKIFTALKDIKEDLYQETQLFKILALEQEIENALDSHEISKARELLATRATSENKKVICEYISFKYCDDIKEEVSSVAAIMLLHELGINFNEFCDYKGYTPIMEAVDHRGKLNVIKALIKSGADVNYGEKRNTGYITPLHLSACNNKVEYVEYLLACGADPKKTYHTLNFLAEKKSQDTLKIIKLLIDAGIPLDDKDVEGNTPIKIAIHYKNTEAVKLLLMTGIMYDECIIDIIKSNNIDLLIHLLENYHVTLPQDIPYYTLKHQTTFGSAISLAMFQYCLGKGMSLKHYTFSDEVVLKTAKATKICLERNDSMDLHFEYYSYSGGFKLSETGGYTLAHFAATCAVEESLAALILAGLDINVKDQEGRTPLHYAAASANPDAVKILILASADINATDSNGKTPLHWAVEHGKAHS